MPRAWFRSALLAALPRAAYSRATRSVELFATPPPARRKTRLLSFERFEARRLLTVDGMLGFDAPEMSSQKTWPDETMPDDTTPAYIESKSTYALPSRRHPPDDDDEDEDNGSGGGNDDGNTPPVDDPMETAPPQLTMEVFDVIFQRPAGGEAYESAVLVVTARLSGGDRDPNSFLAITADVNFDGIIEIGEHTTESGVLRNPGANVSFSYNFFVPDDGPSPGNATPRDVLTIRASYGAIEASYDLAIKNLPPRFIAQPTFSTGNDAAGQPVARVAVQLADIGLVDVHTASVQWSDGVVTSTQNFATINNSCGPIRGRYATVERKLEAGQYVYPVEVRIADDDRAGAADNTGLASVKMSRLDLPLNDDDDNQSNQPDLAELRVSGEDDLRALDLAPLLQPQMTAAAGQFYFSYDVGRIRVWDTADKQRLILPHTIAPMGSSGISFENIPTIPYSGQRNVFVEGIADGQSSISLSWLSNIPYPILHYPGCNPPIAPTPAGSIAITVWSIDIDIDSDNTGVVDLSYAEDLLEMSAPGNLLLLNADDDNRNGIKDYEDDYSTGGGIDDDFDEIILAYTPVSSAENGYKLELGSEQSNVIAIWANGIKRSLDKTSFALGADWIPPRIFVEGIATGTATITWSLTNQAGTTLVTDSVLFTVISGDLRAHRQRTPVFQDYVIPQELEDSHTIGIRRNGDDDDGDAIPDGYDTWTSGEDDTMELETLTLDGGSEVEWVITRSNTSVSIWSDANKFSKILGTPGVGYTPTGFDISNSAVIPGDKTVWIEWPGENSGKATISLYARSANTHTGKLTVDAVTYEPFNSVTVVWMGEFHDPADPPIHTDGSTMGMMQWAIDQYRHGYDVYAFEERDALAAAPLFPAHNAVREAIDKRGVIDVALVGYSHGGGTVWLEANLLTNGPHGISKPFSIVFTGFIDAINQSTWWLGGTPGTLGAVKTRPPGSLYHVSQFQKNTTLTGLWLNGDYSGGDVDIDRSNLGVVHGTIDDSEIVLDLLGRLFRIKVLK